MTATPTRDLVALAVEAAQAAGDLLVRYATDRAAGTDLGITTKTSATDPASEADRAAERLISDLVRASRPDDGFVAEEDQADRRGTTGLRWIVDPLDGTVNFLYGQPLWAVSVACEDDEGPLAGVVCDPNRGETFRAGRGLGAHLGDRELAVSDAADLAGSLVATGFSYDATTRAEWSHRLTSLLPRIRDIRRGGSAALDLAWCAAGRHDGYLEFGLGPWDWAAGSLLVLEAGGVLTRRARRLGGRDLPGLVAGGRSTHDGLLAWVDDEWTAS